MQLDRLQELKEKLVQETDFSKIWYFYMDHFADHLEFTEQGEEVRHKLLESMVSKICQQLCGKKVEIKGLLLIRIPKYQFLHGPFHAKGRIGGVIYFEDIKTGLLAVADAPPSDEVKYSRFSESTREKRGFSPYDYN